MADQESAPEEDPRGPLPHSERQPNSNKRKLKQTYQRDQAALLSLAAATDTASALPDGVVILDADNFPKKRFFRARAHCNPLSNNDGFKYPLTPSHVTWEIHYPHIPAAERIVRIVDMGMGFGGLTVALAKLFPDQLVLGMEIRAKLCEYVRLKIDALRLEHTRSLLPPASTTTASSTTTSSTLIANSAASVDSSSSSASDPVVAHHYNNAACLRTNCMRYLPNFFTKGQLHKLFICFPDPHFKAKNHRRRIVSTALLSEYAYFLCPGGRLYTVTDVKELHDWHVSKCTQHALFRRCDDQEVLDNDAGVGAMLSETEESKKVARNKGDKYYAVFERIGDDELTAGGREAFPGLF